MISSIAVNFNNIGNNKNVLFQAGISPALILGGLIWCHRGCTRSLRWVSCCTRCQASHPREGGWMSQRRSEDIALPWRSGSLCSVRSWSGFVELGTESSSHLLVGFQGFSWAIVAKVFKSKRSLARGFTKKTKKGGSWGGSGLF